MTNPVTSVHHDERQSVAAVLDRSVAALAQRGQTARALRSGDVVLRVTGSHNSQYRLECAPGAISVKTTPGTGRREPLLEVIADAEILRAVLDGERDAREQFLTGGLRVRGDLRYLSEVALELGILKQPL